jgi:hypothetical protein
VGSDRARISYDPWRGYRSVVAQQGRVTLEADINEQSVLASEALRQETIDIVGPAGTPDNGYLVSVDSGGNLTVGPGTMYVGGWRMTLPETVALNSQPEWLDRPAPVQTANGGNEIVALLVTEQEISATEDQALREVALGGPDTAARTRLMQHLIQVPTQDSTCAAAQKDLSGTLAGMGLTLNQQTLELDYTATLQVNQFAPPTSTDPCCPSAQGGYLGADNQLVRVTVPTFSGGYGNLLWGYNNASYFYRAATITATNPAVLQLSQTPVDADHYPQQGQVIEILQTTAVLGNPNNANFVAAPNGQIIPLTSGFAYDPTSRKITLPASVTIAANPDPSAPATVFVRIWEAQTEFNSGASVALVDSKNSPTGLSITVTMTALPSNPFVALPFWCFAVRPNTPQNVYPQRYLDKPQQPEGPRQWLCELAVYTGANAPEGTTIPVTPDCRIPFLPLTELGTCDCCCLTLDPSQDWQGKLAAAMADTAVTAISVCFEPGTFQATGTVLFSGKTVKMTGAGQGTIILGSNLEVVMEFDNCPSVVLTDISVSAGTSGNTKSNGTQFLQGAVTIRNCLQVDIDRVYLTCSDSDFRSASCLYCYNTPNADGAPSLETNLRVLNSQFTVGNSQAGILLVNAYHARVEGNMVNTPAKPRGIDYKNIASFVDTGARLRKQLISGLTLTSTEAKPTADTKRAQKKQAAKAKTATADSAQTQIDGAQTTIDNKAKAKVSASTKAAAVAPLVIKALPQIKLGDVGRATFKATFGAINVELVSSDKLSNAFSNALKKAITTQTPTMAQVRTAVTNIAISALKSPKLVAPAFANYVDALFPELVNTSSQGIVVAGVVANDIRILNNTVEGTAQGIHVGLSNLQTNSRDTHLQAGNVLICGNTVNIRLTPEITYARHGIYLGGVTSALISDNNVDMTRSDNAGRDFTAIIVQGALGPRVLIERNFVQGQRLSGGIFAASIEPMPQVALWKASDNWSPAANSYPQFLNNTVNQPN